MIHVRAAIANLDRVQDPPLRAEFGQLRRNSLLTGCADPPGALLGRHVEGSRQEVPDLALGVTCGKRLLSDCAAIRVAADVLPCRQHRLSRSIDCESLSLLDGGIRLRLLRCLASKMIADLPLEQRQVAQVV